MKMLVVVCLMLTTLLPVACHAGFFADDPKTEQVTNPVEMTIVIPYSKEVNALKISNIEFDNLRWGRPTKQEKITTNEKTADSFKVERRTDNGTAGSGKVYRVSYQSDKSKDAMILKFKAISFSTYQQGLIMPFSVPDFSEQELLEYISHQPLYLSLEFDSQYNTESIYANFMRLAEKVRFRQGEKDPVTGKAYKDKFALSTKYGKVNFSFEAYPYRNGSKAVIHMAVPGTFTSGNTVDFGEIIKEIRGQLEGIVNS